jgi:hypothetical protein
VVQILSTTGTFKEQPYKKIKGTFGPFKKKSLYILKYYFDTVLCWNLDSIFRKKSHHCIAAAPPLWFSWPYYSARCAFCKGCPLKIRTHPNKLSKYKKNFQCHTHMHWVRHVFNSFFAVLSSDFFLLWPRFIYSKVWPLLKFVDSTANYLI